MPKVDFQEVVENLKLFFPLKLKEKRTFISAFHITNIALIIFARKQKVHFELLMKNVDNNEVTEADLRHCRLMIEFLAYPQIDQSSQELAKKQEKRKKKLIKLIKKSEDETSSFYSGAINVPISKILLGSYANQYIAMMNKINEENNRHYATQLSLVTGFMKQNIHDGNLDVTLIVIKYFDFDTRNYFEDIECLQNFKYSIKYDVDYDGDDGEDHDADDNDGDHSCDNFEDVEEHIKDVEDAEDAEIYVHQVFRENLDKLHALSSRLLKAPKRKKLEKFVKG